jgi:hypothetical protein
MRKVPLIDLNCATPDLLFNRFVDKLCSARHVYEKKRIIK